MSSSPAAKPAIGDGQRHCARAGFPEHPGHAASCQRHPCAEAQAAGELGHRKERRPARARAPLQRPDAERDQRGQHDQLGRNGEEEGAQQDRAALERGPAHRPVEAQPAAVHHHTGREAGHQRGKDVDEHR